MFTLVLDLGGGTYVSQYEGPSPAAALRSWAQNELPLLVQAGAPPAVVSLASVADDDPTPLTGLINVWCVTGRVDSELALLNIIATVA